jgi:cysteinyl-tRNA synthetase
MAAETKYGRSRRLAMILALAVLAPAGLPAQDSPLPGGYRGLMRELVRDLAARARRSDPDFIIVAQNGLELLTTDGEPDSPPAADYLKVLDGVGQEELFYGYPRFNQPTRAEDSRYLQRFLESARDAGLAVLVIDYCRSRSKIDDAARRASELGFIGYASPRRELDTIPRYPPSPAGENSRDITTLAGARNFLYLINPGRFSGSRELFTALQGAPHDLLVIDAFVENEPPRYVTLEEVRSLKVKPQGGSRLVLCYLSVGEAESYRPYWRPEYDRNGDGRPDAAAPGWLERENRSWAGNYKVRYWDPAWHELLFAGPGSYLAAIQERGFDGVYLDIIDAFLYFENSTP